MGTIVGCLLCLFVAIVQKKAKLFYPFIALQVTIAFMTAVSMAMLAIAVACNTKYILRHVVDTSGAETHYKRSAVILLSVLSLTLCLQLWYLRTVCSCFRYFTDVAQFKLKQEQGIYI
ncbi:unnamed protein product [Heligmosomoides polygyrus]|uniref:Uncharacterized protein n=1 Tax=Heligmosomoides polygyrus TaxID=6339 RepID=A0A183F2Y9_HELPZ|nr:unnamed protein product [Heligmosomoides polygyrus]